MVNILAGTGDWANLDATSTSGPNKAASGYAAQAEGLMKTTMDALPVHIINYLIELPSATDAGFTQARKIYFGHAGATTAGSVANAAAGLPLLPHMPLFSTIYLIQAAACRFVGSLLLLFLANKLRYRLVTVCRCDPTFVTRTVAAAASNALILHFSHCEASNVWLATVSCVALVLSTMCWLCIEGEDDG